MSMIDAIPLLAGAGADGYQISRSVRLRSSASAYFNRTQTTTTNSVKCTWSGWVKRGNLGILQNIITGSNGTDADTMLYFAANDKLTFYSRITNTNGAPAEFSGESAAVFRDASAWYHIVLRVDTSTAQATNNDYYTVYVNGVAQTFTNTSGANLVSAATVQNRNTCLNVSGYPNRIGVYRASSGYLDGYLTEINFIDGQALTPSSFGETNAVTGVWQPIKYTGTYGTNGFYLNFSDNSGVTATTIGKDYSGNGNNWTPSAGISITAGATYDSMIDVPTLYADGGNGRGNYCTLNPLNKNSVITLSAGNLSFTASNNRFTTGTFAVTSGKWYWEFYPVAGGASGVGVGAISATTYVFGTAAFSTAAGYIGVGYTSNGSKYISGTSSAYGATYGSGNVIGVALDLDSGTKTITFYKDNISQGSINLPTSSEAWIVATDYSEAGTHSINFGQRPFTYTPPTGFVALNTQNLPTPTISNGATVMAATLYTGNDPSTQTITNTVNGVSFQPDLVWVKSRSNAYTHVLVDSVRGVSTALFSNLTNAEVTEATRYVYAFNSNGFSVKENISTGSVNATAGTYVGWQWNAGGSTVTNTSGSISSQVRANATAGFSVVTYTGAGGVSTIGHGLGVAPSFFVVKNRTQASDWECYFATLGNTTRIVLNSTAAQVTGVNGWNSTSPTSTVFTVNGGTAGNTAGNNHLAYCFAAVAGYSAFGKYTGNGSTDGPFVYLGFRPRWVMIKCYDVAGEHWIIYDTARNTYNVVTNELYANLSNAEGTYAPGLLDVTANGFKLRYASAPNASGRNYIYAAFAEVPFRYANAR